MLVRYSFKWYDKHVWLDIHQLKWFFFVFQALAIVNLITFLVTILSTINLLTMLSSPCFASSSIFCSFTWTSSPSTSMRVRCCHLSSRFFISPNLWQVGDKDPHLHYSTKCKPLHLFSSLREKERRLLFFYWYFLLVVV